MKTTHRNTILPLAALLAFASVAPAAELTVQEQFDALKARIAELDAKVRPLQRAETTAGDRGFILSSPDAATSLRIRGLVQFDSRSYFDKNIDNDVLALRRARLGIEGKLGKTTDYQLIGEFAGSSAAILDANVVLNYAPELQIKLGRFKTPVGLEQLQTDTNLLFAERSVVSQLIPNRDIGAQIGGELLGGRVSYAIGVFNGTADGTDSVDSKKDPNDGKDLAARVIFQPWVNDKESPLAGLSFGVGGTYGLQDAASPLTSGFKTDGQQTFFAYRTAGAAASTNTVTANGHVWRLSPQLSYYRGSFGLLAEYVTSSNDIKSVNSAGASAGNTATIKNHAWQTGISYVLTGEEASYKGVIPAADFDRAAGTWGAFEIVGRIASIKFDDSLFGAAVNGAQFADSSKSAQSAQTLGVGLNWYLSKTARFSLDYEYTSFKQFAGATAPAASSVINHPERLLLARFGLTF
jgi:phosphate-selective porin OprO/OprP